MTDQMKANMILRYTAPKVVVYGGMAQLTAGGGSAIGENLNAAPGSNAFMRKT